MRRNVIAGGGAAGFFAAIACAEASPEAETWLLEKGSHFLAKVRISGGGRCNVTHACYDPRLLSEHYPRGRRALIGLFHRFQAQDTIEWFERRGVRLKTEADGRIFPRSDSSGTIIDCLTSAARAAGVLLRSRSGIERATPDGEGGFQLGLTGGEMVACQRLLLATGGCRDPAGAAIARSLGHTIEPAVPSLFAFESPSSSLRELAGVSVEDVEGSIPAGNLRERGALLATHRGVSGPVILRLSAWGARDLQKCGYRFALRLNWLPRLNAEELAAALEKRRAANPAKYVINTPLEPLPARLWEWLAQTAGVKAELRWAALSQPAAQKLLRQISATEIEVNGKSLNKDEFVTCGGVPLKEVDLKRMESRLQPGLHFAGELLDIDGITGGFNFQAAWTTGWLAGRAMAEAGELPDGKSAARPERR